MTLLITVVLVALIFEYINGFHDTANSIAMGVSTKVLTPRQAILLATSMNLLGALVGTAVAKTISSGLVDAKFVDAATIVSALLAGIIRNLLTGWFGLPSSSSHALIGGLVGATSASAGGEMASVIWFEPGNGHWWQGTGIFDKVVMPMILSPVIGFTAGLTVMSLLYVAFTRSKPVTVNKGFRFLQMFSGSFMGFSHGSNDAQKTMGIIALALVTGTNAGVLNDAPNWLSFLRVPDLGPQNDHIPAWIKIVCAVVMAAGTAAGGWRIIA